MFFITVPCAIRDKRNACTIRVQQFEATEVSTQQFGRRFWQQQFIEYKIEIPETLREDAVESLRALARVELWNCIVLAHNSLIVRQFNNSTFRVAEYSTVQQPSETASKSGRNTKHEPESQCTIS